MDTSLTSLIAANLAFVGSHFALSHPLRPAVIKAAGATGFQVVYSLVALAIFAWIVLAYRAADPGGALWSGQGDAPWIAATVIMLVASVLLAGSFAGNPALPAPGAEALARQDAHGVFRVTRHPMMWSIALWSAAHVLVSPSPRVIAVSAGMAALALIGSRLQDRKKAKLMGDAWQDWERRTSYLPRLGGLARAGAVPWIVGTALWLGATWAHGWLIGVPAGVWRWL